MPRSGGAAHAAAGGAPVARPLKYSRWRAASLATVYLLFGIHIAHWRLHGSTLAPLELNEVLYTVELGILTAGFLFMVVALLSVFVFGRFFCSWMCHILVLEDLAAWLAEEGGDPADRHTLPGPPARPLLRDGLHVHLAADHPAGRGAAASRAPHQDGCQRVGLVRDDELLAQPARTLDHRADLRGVRLRDRVLPRNAFLLHVRLPVRGGLRIRGPFRAGQDRCHRRVRGVRDLFLRVPVPRPGSGGDPALREGREPELHEGPGLHQRLPEREASLRLHETVLLHFLAARQEARDPLRLLARRGHPHGGHVPRHAVRIPRSVPGRSVPPDAGHGRDHRLSLGPDRALREEVGCAVERDAAQAIGADHGAGMGLCGPCGSARDLHRP